MKWFLELFLKCVLASLLKKGGRERHIYRPPGQGGGIYCFGCRQRLKEGVSLALTTDQSEIGAGLVNFYKQLFSDDEVRRPLLDGLVFSSLDESDRDLLDQPFTEEEVWGVVRNMAGDKAPGPDGFSLAFFQSCWEVIKQDVMQVFHEFHTTRNFERSMNVTFLALIPKKPGAQECKDFRPISLVTGIYKIIAKVLANRLRSVD